uniref:Uncharacterized protein n=1 Tax=Hanusia phi TaxID=3032 RepID=A0A7S0E4P1_9CRYP|mmetsp:Transcript_16738/g.38196  ORF Transcript_16738/g.38196 Transcript_16738/m.38196 type:complete len:217 (+) Transcript_16738:41-691(+)
MRAVRLQVFLLLLLFPPASAELSTLQTPTGKMVRSMSTALRTVQWAFLGSDRPLVSRGTADEADVREVRAVGMADEEEEEEEWQQQEQGGEEVEGKKSHGSSSKSFFSLARSMSQDNLESIKISAHVTKKAASTLGSSLSSSLTMAVRAVVVSVINFLLEFRRLLSLGLDSRLDELQSRINRVEKEQEDVRSEICTLRAQVGELSKKLQGVQPTEQ